MKLSKKLQMKETKQINKLKISVSSVDFNSNQIAPLLWLENKTQLYSIFFLHIYKYKLNRTTQKQMLIPKCMLWIAENYNW